MVVVGWEKCEMWQAYCSGVYANNMKHIYTPVHLVTLLTAVSSYACKHKCIHLSMSSYNYTYKNTWRVMYDSCKCTDRHSCLSRYMYIYTYTCIHVCLNTCLNIHTCYIHACLPTYKHICMHTTYMYVS